MNEIANADAVTRVSKALENFYDIDGMTLKKAKTIIQSIEDDLITLYPRAHDASDDSRLGNETYGYKSDDDILHSLLYISDRWGAAFRIAWMLGLVNEDYR